MTTRLEVDTDQDRHVCRVLVRGVDRGVLRLDEEPAELDSGTDVPMPELIVVERRGARKHRACATIGVPPSVHDDRRTLGRAIRREVLEPIETSATQEVDLRIDRAL